MFFINQKESRSAYFMRVLKDKLDQLEKGQSY